MMARLDGHVGSMTGFTLTRETRVQRRRRSVFQPKVTPASAGRAASYLGWVVHKSGNLFEVDEFNIMQPGVGPATSVQPLANIRNAVGVDGHVKTLGPSRSVIDHVFEMRKHSGTIYSK